ncbi:proteasome subunit beta [Candidatus Woesearchaeota archaeon]|nr:proteasome subunit beta [Candidatus Woesearchaeota archaeon]
MDLKKGTTTVGIVCKDGIILAGDKRTSAGYLISDSQTEKVYKISNYMAITIAGLVSDTQLFTKIIRAQLNLMRIRRNREPTVKEAANLLSSLIYGHIRQPSMIFGAVGFLLGGYDKDGFHLYELGMDGSLTQSDDYRSSGSGSYVAYGVLETIYKKDCTLQEGIKIAVKSINAAIKRDMPTGDGIDVIAITPAGVSNVFQKKLNLSLE